MLSCHNVFPLPFCPTAPVRTTALHDTHQPQKKAVLADDKLPEEFRVALATVVDRDLFEKAWTPMSDHQIKNPEFALNIIF